MATGLPTSLDYIRNKQKPLQFREDSTFRILHITDIHEVDPEMDDDKNPAVPRDKSAETMHVIETALEKAQPDLVVFGGDNISGYWEEFTYDYVYKTIKKIVEPIAKRNIPLAIVFGNHDSEGEEKAPFKRHEVQVAIYSEYENFRGTMNEEEMFGACNYVLPILSSDGKKVAWNVWCIDSNDYIRDEEHNVIEGKGYGFVHKNQIEWYERRSAQINEENGYNVPSILFQHIPVNQEWDLYTEVTENDSYDLEDNGRYFKIDYDRIKAGRVGEKPCPPQEHREQFESWKKTGNIVAAFFGHDHINSFEAEIDGIKLIQTVGAGYHTYGEERGARLIVLKENSREFETETILVDRITDTDFDD